MSQHIVLKDAKSPTKARIEKYQCLDDVPLQFSTQTTQVGGTLKRYREMDGKEGPTLKERVDGYSAGGADSPSP